MCLKLCRGNLVKSLQRSKMPIPPGIQAHPKCTLLPWSGSHLLLVWSGSHMLLVWSGSHMLLPALATAVQQRCGATTVHRCQDWQVVMKQSITTAVFASEPRGAFDGTCTSVGYKVFQWHNFDPSCHKLIRDRMPCLALPWQGGCSKRTRSVLDSPASAASR